MDEQYYDDNLWNRLDKKFNLNVKVGDTYEKWRFLFSKKICVGLRRNKGPIYFRADNGDPRNGTSEGLYFYRVIDGEQMEKIRVYDGHAGQIRSSESRYDVYWKLLYEWRAI